MYVSDAVRAYNADVVCLAQVFLRGEPEPVLLLCDVLKSWPCPALRLDLLVCPFGPTNLDSAHSVLLKGLGLRRLYPFS